MANLLNTLGIDRLSLEDRLTLLGDLWENLSEDSDRLPLLESQRADLQRRLDAIDANPSRGSSWEQVKLRLQNGS
ncbi:MAG TPA: addiction module protein [Urbifossiella sp.]|nr:addiction module protein [Urbifossiella sp.]